MSLKALAKQIKQANKERNKTIEEIFIEEIDNYLVNNAEEESDRVAFNPSSYYKCIRQLAYKLWKVKGNKRVYARSQRILGVGTALHRWIQEDILMKMDKDKNSSLKLLPVEELPAYKVKGFEIVKEHNAPPTEIKFLDHRWTEKIPISAMVDGALELNNKCFLFEFKTINHKDFEFLIEPLPDHIKQGAVYALCTGIYSVMFLYLCKGTQNLKAYLVEYSPEQLEWVKTRIRTAEQFVVNKALPPKEESSQCRWCEYKHLCDKDETGL